MKLVGALLLALLVGGVSSTPASAQALGYLGEVRFLAFDFCPKGWTEADGKQLGITNNTALYTLIFDRYDEEWDDKFTLPRLRKQIVAKVGEGEEVSLKPCVAIHGAYPPRDE